VLEVSFFPVHYWRLLSLNDEKRHVVLAGVLTLSVVSRPLQGTTVL
jgi:hypothetical protein